MEITYIGACLDSCYSDDTEVLTEQGWKFFRDLRSKDKLATLNEVHNIEYHYPTRLIKNSWDGKLLRFFNSRSGVDVLVTPNHSMYTQTRCQRTKNPTKWQFERASDAFGRYRFYKKNANYQRSELKEVMIANRTLDIRHWLEFLGYYLSEGSATITKRKNYIVQIRQSGKSPHFEKMAIALQRVVKGKVNAKIKDDRIIANDKELVLYLKQLGDKYHKHIPREILNKASLDELKVLFNALMDGDGHRYYKGGDAYFTSSIRLRDDFQELLLKIGLSGSYVKKYSKGDILRVFDRKHIAREDHWAISIRNVRHEVTLSNWTRRSNCYSEVLYSGDVYCATVPNHTLFIRRNGCAVWSGNSGYAEAARNNIAALHSVGVKQSVFPISFESKKADMGQLGNLIKSLIGPDNSTHIRILHATPPNYQRLIKKKKHYNIGYAAWETDRLPKDWVPMVNLLDEIWCPSTHNKKVFRNSGVKIPITVIPHTFDVNGYDITGEIDSIVNGREEEFFFYSIFQWLERKNPVGLLKAYLTEFKHDENVTLVLKTFRLNAGENNDTAVITRAIRTIKTSLYLEKYPRLLLISSLMTRDQMVAFHDQCDCYVSLNRCEGFGIPLTEAMLVGNPVIATAYGGAADFLSKEIGYPVDYMITPVAAMPWPMYTGEMNWAEPDLMQARRYMRVVFKDRKAAKEKGKLAKRWVKDNLNWETIGKLMKERLEQINENLF